jgi:hypothetical protein
MRYRSIESKTKAKILFVSNIPAMGFVNFLLLFSGGIMCFLYFFGCDPYQSTRLWNKNQIGAYWLHDILAKNAPSLSGILFASIIYYALVQHSLGVELCSRALMQEAINPMLLNKVRRVKKAHKEALTKILSLFLGCLSIAYSISFQYARNTMISLFFVFNNSINSPILGFYLLSVFNPFANHVGAICAFLLNLAINAFMAIGTVMIARTKSQEFPLNTVLCDVDLHISKNNITHIKYNYHNNAFINSTSQATQPDLYPKDPILFFFFTVAPIWYCLFSVLFTFIMGSVFSFAYSLYKTKFRSLDVDADWSEQRKEYLFYYRLKRN